MSDHSVLLEIPVFSADDAISASQLGADRLELCASYSEGGLTPGAGLLKVVKQNVDTPVFVMLRPVGGHFHYSETDLDVMAEELVVLKSFGADGFVFGILNSDQSVNKRACRRLVDLADELPCTFHRAFDEVSDPFTALKEIKELGFQRILTSGQQPDVGKGMSMLTDLLEKAGDDIIIMPGGGMKPEFIKTLNRNGRLKEIHASCRKRGVTMDISSPKSSMINENVVANFKNEMF